MKEIYSPALFYYALGKNDPRFIICRVELDNEINRDIMAEAVAAAMKRYPYLRVCLAAVDERLVLEETDAPVLLYDDITLRAEENNGYLFRFVANDNRLGLVASHAFLDGASAQELLGTLLYEYYRMVDGKAPSRKGLKILGDEIGPEEYEDPMGSLEWSLELPKPSKEDTRTYLLPDKPDGKNWFYRFSIRKDELMSFAKGHDGSPNAVVSLFFAKAVDRLCHVPEGYEIHEGIAVNTKRILGKGSSYMNCVSLITVPYSNKLKNMDVTTQLTAVRGRIMLETDPEIIIPKSGGILMCQKMIAAVPTLEEKRKLATEILKKDQARTTVGNSYTGAFVYEGISNHIRHMDLLASTDNPVIQVSCLEDHFDLTMCQPFENDIYVRAFMDIMEENGIHCTYRGEESMLPVKYEPVTA